MKSHNLLVAGGRDFVDYALMCDVLDMYRKHYNVDIIIQGEANGADRLAQRYALDNSIMCVNMPADWDKHGKKAGYIRNAEMWSLASRGIIFWDGKSKGTAHSLKLAEKRNKTLYVCNYITNDFYIHYQEQAR